MKKEFSSCHALVYSSPSDKHPQNVAHYIHKHTFGGSCRLHFFKAASADSRRAILSSRSLTACFTSVSMASNCQGKQC